MTRDEYKSEYDAIELKYSKRHGLISPDPQERVRELRALWTRAAAEGAFGEEWT